MNNSSKLSISRFPRGEAAIQLWSSALLLLTAFQAQSAPSKPDTDLEQVITTASRVESDASQHIGSVSAVDEEALKLIAPVHIQESLLRVPGVNINRGEGQEYLPAIRSPVLTGAGACGGFLMAEDGIPLRAAGFCNINELFEAHTEIAQRIEVLRGPGTTLYGSNAVHGVVNVITPGVAEMNSALGFEAGPYGYSRLKVSAAPGQGNSRLAVGLSVTRDDGYRQQSGFDQQKLTLRHQYQGSIWQADSGLTATNLEQETAGYIGGLDAYKDEQLARSNPDPEAYRDARSLRLWSKLSRSLENGGQVLITPYARHTDMEFLQHFLPGDPLEENGQVGAGVLTTYMRPLSDEIDMIAGIDAEYTSGYLREMQDTPTPGSAFLQATIPTGKHYDYDVDATMLAPYVQLDWRLTERWMLTAGVRYEWMQYDYRNDMIDGRTREDGTECGFGGCRFSRPPSGKDRFENWSPKLGLSYQVAENQLLYLSLARGFRAPQTSELYRLQRDQQLAELDSEQVDSIELGWKGHSSSLNYGLALYSMEKENYIFRDVDFFNVSDGKTRHRGVEINANYRFTQAWDVGFGASYAEHTYRYDELMSGININANQVDTAPRVFGSAQLGWKYSRGRAELEWQHMGRYYLDPENLHEYPGHDLLNLRAGMQLQPGLELYGRVLNLTDRAYAERADYTSFSDERYFPGRPRTFYVGVEWQWQ